MKHLKDQNLSYIKHLSFAWSISGRLVLLAIIGVIHGLVPWIFQSWVSSGVHEINKTFDVDG
tara:strand:+ start:4766 stop:4951 length:186 start_codon:yes stop_codon:yes gene_type:complete